MKVPNVGATSSRLAPFALPWAGVSGLALGLAYAASPVTFWVSVAMAGVFAWAGRGLSRGERRWVWRLLAVAVALRLLAVGVLFLTSDPHSVGAFFWEPDGAHLVSRTIWIRNVWMGIPVPPYYFNQIHQEYGRTTFSYPLAYLHYVLGPAPYGVHVVNIALFVATTVMLYRLIRSSFGRESALVGLALLLFLPTLFAWSVSALKEPPFVFLIAVALVATVTVLRARPLLSRALALAALVASFAAIDGVRPGGKMIVAVGLAAGLAGSVVIRRALLLPLVPVLLIIAGSHAVNDPAIQRRIMSNLKYSAVIHLGHVRTVGNHYKLLDQRFYADRGTAVTETMTEAEGVRFAVRALVSFMVFPLPWQIQSWEEVAFLAQQILWYALIVLAVVGLFAGLRRDALVTCTLAGVAIVGAGGVALTSGNFGTMARHRDMVVPFVVWLSALGGVVTLSRWTSRSRLETSTEVAPHGVLEMPTGADAIGER